MSLLTLDIEKPAAGGRMVARHQGRVVLVSGAIPGERVVARVTRTGKGVVFADVVDVLTPSADRRADTMEAGCGGNVFAHVVYPRQCQLKGQILHDAFRRIGRVELDKAPGVIESPERGYRMRARVHAREGRLGFFREGTRHLCAVRSTGQLLERTCDWLDQAEQTLRSRRLTGVESMELVENVPGDQRACHLHLERGVDPTPFEALAPELTGLSAQRADRSRVVVLSGTPAVRDDLRTSDVKGAPVVTVARDVRAFFQGNRFLIERLVWLVTARVPTGPVIDLYAGVGLFGLALAARGIDAVTAVEGEAASGSDLARNAGPYASHVRVVRDSVEAFLRRADLRSPGASVILDPPRTGLSRAAVEGTIALGSPRIVYVSCDVATLARDARLLMDAGYGLESVVGVDLFPNTAHVESVAVLTR